MACMLLGHVVSRILSNAFQNVGTSVLSLAWLETTGGREYVRQCTMQCVIHMGQIVLYSR